MSTHTRQVMYDSTRPCDNDGWSSGGGGMGRGERHRVAVGHRAGDGGDAVQAREAQPLARLALHALYAAVTRLAQYL